MRFVLLLLGTCVAACASEDESTWTGLIVGEVVGEDVGPSLELSSLGGLRFCRGGLAYERFARRVAPDGSFRIGMGEINTGHLPRCFDLVVGRDGESFDTIPDLGPVNFHEGRPLDSLYLKIRVFGSDSAQVIESVTMPGRGG